MICLISERKKGNKKGSSVDDRRWKGLQRKSEKVVKASHGPRANCMGERRKKIKMFNESKKLFHHKMEARREKKEIIKTRELRWDLWTTEWDRFSCTLQWNLITFFSVCFIIHEIKLEIFSSGPFWWFMNWVKSLIKLFIVYFSLIFDYIQVLIQFTHVT